MKKHPLGEVGYSCGYCGKHEKDMDFGEVLKRHNNCIAAFARGSRFAKKSKAFKIKNN